jgi:Arc/MetJ-type ribon-helix-helix transcriptional regulator
VTLAREYDDRMNRRITVSLPEHLVAEATAAVREGRAPSVSAYVAEALVQKSGREPLAKVLADWEAEIGPPSAEAEAWADDVFARLGLDAP